MTLLGGGTPPPAGGLQRRPAPLRVILAGQDVTDRHGGLQFSNADPGGLEAASLQVPRLYDVMPGSPLEVWHGLDRLWTGEVLDPGDRTQRDRAWAQVAAVGPGFRLKDNPFAALFVHSRLADHKDARSFPEADLSVTPAAGTVGADGAIVIGMESASTFTSGHAVGVVLDLGAGNLARRAVVTWSSTIGTANVTLYCRATNTPTLNAAGSDAVNQLVAVGPQTHAGTFATPGRYVQLFLYRNGATASPLGADLQVRLTAVQVFADAAYESGNASVLTPSDVARAVLRRSGARVAAGRIDDASSLRIAHLHTTEPQNAEQWIAGAARLMGWHYGTWSPATMLDDTPVLDFRAVPSAATAAVAWADCPQGDPPRARLDQLYNACRCTYTDAAGTVASQTATIPTPLLERDRTLEVNMGTGDAASAAAYARFALGLSQRAARGGGWATLPPYVQTPGGPRPSCTLQAGRDRIRLLGIADPRSMLDDRLALDTFHLRRVEVTIGRGGAPQTRVEFDGGGDLMEVLNARLELAAVNY